MDVYENRRLNLKAEIGHDRGAIKSYADAHDLNESYLSQIINKHRRLGEKAARHLERKAGLEPFFLDADPAEHGKTDPIRGIRTALDSAEWLDSSIKEGILRTLESLRPKK